MAEITEGRRDSDCVHFPGFPEAQVTAEVRGFTVSKAPLLVIQEDDQSEVPEKALFFHPQSL